MRYLVDHVGEAAMPMPKKGKFVTVDGVKTHYYEKGRGKTVILVHGGNFWLGGGIRQ